MPSDRVNTNRLASEMYARRVAFGYVYRRADYQPTADLQARWAHAPWVTGDMAPSASNMSAAILRDVAPYLPVHDHA